MAPSSAARDVWRNIGRNPRSSLSSAATRRIRRRLVRQGLLARMDTGRELLHLVCWAAVYHQRAGQVAYGSTILFGAPQLAQFGAAGKQVVERPLRLDLTSFEDDDPVGPLQCDTAMRHGQNRRGLEVGDWGLGSVLQPQTPNSHPLVQPFP